MNLMVIMVSLSAHSRSPTYFSRYITSCTIQLFYDLGSLIILFWNSSTLVLSILLKNKLIRIKYLPLSASEHETAGVKETAVVATEFSGNGVATNS